ncbi:hypothetical protein F2Q69_00035740 [Brassica cretica]|uniref:Uncharacterized protein n=1 Tax=Brassica cretica TaxID=69181 RepID=A0A8S9SN17_BRACR|nr:hypothetical protein F2Q69_00035740 [Brassica cretica]
MLVVKRQSSDGGCLLRNRLVGRSKNSRSRGGNFAADCCEVIASLPPIDYPSDVCPFDKQIFIVRSPIPGMRRERHGVAHRHMVRLIETIRHSNESQCGDQWSDLDRVMYSHSS